MSCKKCKNPEETFSKIWSKNWLDSEKAKNLIFEKECPCRIKSHKSIWEKKKAAFLESKGFYFSMITGTLKILEIPQFSQLSLDFSSQKGGDA